MTLLRTGIPHSAAFEWAVRQFYPPEEGDGNWSKLSVGTKTAGRQEICILRGLDPTATYERIDHDAGVSKTISEGDCMQQRLQMEIAGRPAAGDYRL
jgi:hypothetical protein